jgi:hypothetical protein
LAISVNSAHDHDLTEEEPAETIGMATQTQGAKG